MKRKRTIYGIRERETQFTMINKLRNPVEDYLIFFVNKIVSVTYFTALGPSPTRTMNIPASKTTQNPNPSSY